MAPTAVPALLVAATASDPGRPRLTWYGADGDRVELSARVLTNWVAKTADLLLEEVDVDDAAGVPPAVLLDLPVHWRSVVWGLAAWAAGVQVVTAGSPAADGAALVVTTGPAATPAPPAGTPLVVVALPALALRGSDVPPGAVDYNAVVAGYSDQLPLFAQPLALDVEPAGAPDGPGSGAGPRGPRVLLEAGPADLTEVLRAVVAALAADGSVVLRGPGAPDAAHLAAVENATG